MYVTVMNRQARCQFSGRFHLAHASMTAAERHVPKPEIGPMMVSCSWSPAKNLPLTPCDTAWQFVRKLGLGFRV